LLDGGVADQAQGFALDDQVVPDPHGLVAEAIPDLDLRPDWVRQWAGAARQAGVDVAVQRRKPLENPLEPLARAAERLRLSLPDLPLHVGEPIGLAPGLTTSGPDEVA
jgi:hypothetical protein